MISTSSPYIWQSLAPVSSRFLEEFHYVRVSSDPEVDSDCTRDKVFTWRWRRVGFFALLRAVFALRPVGRRLPGLLQFFRRRWPKVVGCKGPRGCWGRWEFYSLVTWHPGVPINFDDLWPYRVGVNNNEHPTTNNPTTADPLDVGVRAQ